MWSRSDDNNNSTSSTFPVSLGGLERESVDLLRKAKPKDCKSLIQKGEHYFQKGEYMKAMLFYQKAADLSDPEAMRRVGCLYLLGRGVRKNDTAAVEWIMYAANKGHEGAQYNIGLFYEFGRAVPRDLHIALIWYHRSTIRGNPDAVRAIQRLQKMGYSIEIAKRDHLTNEHMIVELNKQINTLANNFSEMQITVSVLEDYVDDIMEDMYNYSFYSDSDKTEPEPDYL